MPDFAAYMHDPASIPDDVRRRDASVVRQQPAERLGDRPELPVAAQLARQPHAPRPVHHEALPLLGRRDVLAQPPPAVAGRRELRPTCAASWRRRAVGRLYAPPTSIVPATGAVTNVDSRVSPLFGSVNGLRSDLESRSAQYTFTLQPIGFSTINTRWTVSYVYSDPRADARLRRDDGGQSATSSGRAASAASTRSTSTCTRACAISSRSRSRGARSPVCCSRRSSTATSTATALSNDRAFVFNPADGQIRASPPA